MKAFVEPYYVQENFWGITSKDLSEVVGEPLERVNWVIEKMKREKGGTDLDIIKIEGPEKSPSEGVYALSPDGVVGTAFYLGSDRSLAYARYMSYAEDRIDLYRRLVNFRVDRNLPAEQKLEMMRVYSEFLKLAVQLGKRLSAKNSFLRLLYKSYAKTSVEIKKYSAA